MRKFFKHAFIFLFVAVSFQSILVNLYQSVTPSFADCEEATNYNQLLRGGAISHKRSWTNSRSISGFCTNYSVFDSQQKASEDFRASYNPTKEDFYYQYWGNLYQSLYELNRDDLRNIEDSLAIIRDQNDMSGSEFAHLIVSFIQDIPYSYVMSGSCDEIKDGKPCRGNSRFGILSPIEFLYTLDGDCDTRTVLLYSLLIHFGYEPLILISNEYLHSMLALNIPSTGDHLMHKGKKFYFWETTNTGWEPGMLAPDMKNKNYWKIALDYEY